ncbi:cilia and flagella associated protein 410 [Denticeps clupeoides]|uniref:Cilia- and flagella-associated protein 410 n=1 Tax=Denticeps clupeoides TaxID=299321 RepID=A0AAY4AUM7_9TELE|nr:cilia- and flagella-associated protein 410 [Denticeps clupeoides]
MKLTRKLVLARAKSSDLDSVRKLNCWGCNLTDISIFSEIPNIEVLTLSANNISSLEHIGNCQNLTELYLRRNNIQNLSELSYLKCLAHLRVLWLAENPCCDDDPVKYRLTVLRNLPGLHKLDNQVVTEEELALALQDGDEVLCPSGTASANSTNGLTEADSENDPLNYSMEETNKIRAQLGMKPLPRDKFPSFSSPREHGATSRRKSHTLEAVLLLLKDLDMEELKIVHTATENKLRVRARHKEKTPVVEQ